MTTIAVLLAAAFCVGAFTRGYARILRAKHGVK